MENLNPILLVVILGCINWFATSLGGSAVFFERKNKILNYSNILALSAGIMLSASFWSLLLPAVEMANDYNQKVWFVLSFGFLAGILFLHLISKYSNKIFKNNVKPSHSMLITALAIHNIPDVIVVFWKL